ncbi:MAG: hypothetical protein HQ530_05000 [Parcubacteria group bacterium]|nr:hypothetical protein [Parcubacteria group bacterium]
MKALVLALLVTLLGGCPEEQPGLDVIGDAKGGDAAVSDLAGDGASDGDGKMVPDLVLPPDSDPNKMSCYTSSSGCTGTPGSVYKCQGICRAGVMLRDKNTGQWGACQGQVLSIGFEICGDGRDTNCDGDKNQGCQTLIFFGGKVSGKTVTDDSGKGKHGTLQGGVSSKKGGIKGGEYLSFAGKKSRVNFPIAFGTNITIAFWFRTSDLAKIKAEAGWLFVFGKNDSSNTSKPRWAAIINPGLQLGTVRGWFEVPGSSHHQEFHFGATTSSALVIDGQWHLAVFTTTVAWRAFYLDGAVVTSEANKIVYGSYKIDFSGVKLGVIGHRKDAPDVGALKGDIDDFQLDSHVWTAAEVKSYYNFLKP